MYTESVWYYMCILAQCCFTYGFTYVYWLTVVLHMYTDSVWFYIWSYICTLTQFVLHMVLHMHTDSMCFTYVYWLSVFYISILAQYGFTYIYILTQCGFTYVYWLSVILHNYVYWLSVVLHKNNDSVNTRFPTVVKKACLTNLHLSLLCCCMQESLTPCLCVWRK